jgi:hypothetical protein
MSSKGEVGRNISQTEQAELTPAEQAVERVKRYYGGVALVSARFQALADRIREIAAERICEFNKEDQSGVNRLNEIRRTIRQRENTDEVYKIELKQATLFVDELTNALSAEGASKYSQIHGVPDFFYRDILWKRINQEIERKS